MTKFKRKSTLKAANAFTGGPLVLCPCCRDGLLEFVNEEPSTCGWCAWSGPMPEDAIIFGQAFIRSVDATKGTVTVTRPR